MALALTRLPFGSVSSWDEDSEDEVEDEEGLRDRRLFFFFRLFFRLRLRFLGCFRRLTGRA